MKLKPLTYGLLAFFLLGVLPVQADKKLEEEYLYALELFRDAEYAKSSFLLQQILEDPESDDLYAGAHYWIGRCALATGNLDIAADLLNFYIKEYPQHINQEDARYFAGRVLFLQGNYEQTIQYFSHAIVKNPDWTYRPLCLYWIGESLYALGRLDEAARIFQDILDEYPYSVKTEAIHYRLSLIEYRWREEELLKLLQWSHEEFLRNSEDFSKQEKIMAKTISDYEQKLQELEKIRRAYDDKLKLLALKEDTLNFKAQLKNRGGEAEK